MSTSPTSCASTWSVASGLALARFADRIGRVIVRFSQADGDANVGHKRCQIEVGLHPQRVDVEDTDIDLFAAVNHATDRAARSVARAVEGRL